MNIGTSQKSLNRKLSLPKIKRSSDIDAGDLEIFRKASNIRSRSLMKNTGVRNTINHHKTTKNKHYQQTVLKNLYETDLSNDDVFKLDLRDMPLSIRSK